MVARQMRCVMRALLTTVLVLCAACFPAVSCAQDELATSGGPAVPPETCRYWEDQDFSGEHADIPLGVKRRLGDHWNDEISSIACANRCRLQVWEHRDFNGATKWFAGGYASQYVGDDWNDRISSMVVACDMESTDSSDCKYGSDTCDRGFVWREASPSDHVCVKPDIRDRTRKENASADANRAGGGAYGPDTCKQGFVWREAFPGDVVCVKPQSRDQARIDNGRGGVRRACKGR